MHQNLLIILRKLISKTNRTLLKVSFFDEVRNHMDFFFNVKKSQCILFQTFRNRSQRIRLIDRKFYGMFIARMLPYQSNIRSVKRSHQR